MTMNSKFELTNVGPIKGQFSIDLSAGPGLYELRGGKGTGKSTILSALSLISGHKVSLTVYDGELSGQIKGFGVVAPVGSRKRKKGELELETIDTTRCDLGDLIDPDGKTAETRDAARIKALAALSNLRMVPSDFYELVGGQQSFDELGVQDSDDAVTMCGRVKSAIEEQARRHESLAEREQGYAKANSERCDGIDVNSEYDPNILAMAAETAARDLVRLKDGRERRLTAEKQRASATEALAKATADYTGPSVEEAAANVEKATEKRDKLRDQLVKAVANLRIAEEKATAAEQHHRTTVAWRVTLAEELPPEVIEQQIAEAQIKLETARADQEMGVRIRDALQASEQAAKHKRAAEQAITIAKRYRAIAGNVWDVLTSKLATHELKIESVDGYPRLVVQHPKRGKTVYDCDNGLSDGERVRVAIDEMLPRLKSPGLLPLPQRIWQDLPPKDRSEIARYAMEKGLYVFAAQVTDDDLGVYRYES